MKLTNDLGLPEPVYAAILNDDYDPGLPEGVDPEKYFTVSELCGPPRIAALKRKHDAELTEDVADRIYALLGQAIHTVLERAGYEGIRESRLYMPVGPYIVGGRLDRTIVLPDLTIQEYKLASLWEVVYGLKEEREWQVNLQGALWRANKVEPKRLQVVMMLRDWSKPEAARSGKDSSYPKHQATVLDVPLWEAQKAQAFALERCELHAKARTGKLPLCSPEERWERPTTWAVKQPGRQKALRVLRSEAAAEAWCEEQVGPGWGRKVGIEKRPGEATRCRFYCPVKDVCTQYQLALATGADVVTDDA